MQIKMIKLVLIFIIFCLVFTVPVFAQEVPSASSGQAPPTTSPTQIVSSSGAPFNVGWNYFTVSAAECTLKNIFNELQAAGGGALLAGEIWKMSAQGGSASGGENAQWKMFNVTDSNNVKVTSDNIFAFNSNQKFYINIAPDACKTKNTNRDSQIEQVRDASTRQNGDSFLEKLLSVPGDFWNGLFGKMEVNKQDNTLTNPKYSGETAVFTTLNVLGKTTLTDLGITGKISAGLLAINGLDCSNCSIAGNFASINTLSSDLYLQNQLLGGINILNGRILIDINGNLKLEGGSLTAKKININESDSSSASIGGGVIPAGNVSVTIQTIVVNSSSRVFVTPVSETDKPLVVKNIVAGKSFDVIIVSPYTADVKFNWWIVN